MLFLPHDVFSRVYATKTHLFWLTRRLIATSRRREGGDRSSRAAFPEKKERRNLIDCVRTLGVATACKSPPQRVKATGAHLVTRFTRLTSRYLCEENPLLHKIQYPPGGAISSGAVLEGRAIPESACALSAAFLTSRRKFFRN